MVRKIGLGPLTTLDFHKSPVKSAHEVQILSVHVHLHVCLAKIIGATVFRYSLKHIFLAWTITAISLSAV